jgi:hypothetical protein
MPPELHPRNWDERTWDRFGYMLLALFFVAAMSDPEFLVFVLIFGFVGFLLWTAFKDPTK